MSEDAREHVAKELRRIREAVRDRALLERSPGEVLPPPKETPKPEVPPREPEPERPPEPKVPDPRGVNEGWDVSRVAPSGSWLGRWLRRLLAPLIDAQVSFNSRQVQLDNELLAYIDTRLDATHRHYDAVLGTYGRHMQEIDERHLILQEELVAHVHDLVKRIDLVFSETERGRLSLEFALRDLRADLARLEKLLDHR